MGDPQKRWGGTRRELLHSKAVEILGLPAEPRHVFTNGMGRESAAPNRRLAQAGIFITGRQRWLREEQGQRKRLGGAQLPWVSAEGARQTAGVGESGKDLS